MKLTKDQIDATVLWARMLMSIDDVPLQMNRASVERMLEVIVALADENDRLRAERGEVIALLETLTGPTGTGRCTRAHLGQDGCSVSPRCAFHAGLDLIAKLKASL